MKRRTFLQTTGVIAAGAGLPLPGLRPLPTPYSPSLEAGTTVLFQGDSITDCGRDRTVAGENAASALGNGYPLLIASRLLAERAKAGYRFFNRGVSGNTVPDCDARWQTDTLALAPDVLSILIGVNDYWHTLNGGYKGTADDYEHQFTALLARTRTALPKVRLVILEPFTLRTGVITDAWFPAFDERRRIARRVADAAGATFLATQDLFDRLSRHAPPAYWASDGVHPTPAGHGAIADMWMEAVGL
ncbi:MAG TPA: SGNH/GDSL hydrolase family protein [Gemmatimonadales bacterium]|nr:SGNH/GDSL hydrolase family protein [Gemmatimonadales bacterium]